MLDEKTHALAAIAASITANCQPCLDYHTGHAREAGIGEPDIAASIDIGKQVRRGAAAAMDKKIATRIGERCESAGTGGCGCR